MFKSPLSHLDCCRPPLSYRLILRVRPKHQGSRSLSLSCCSPSGALGNVFIARDSTKMAASKDILGEMLVRLRSPRVLLAAILLLSFFSLCYVNLHSRLPISSTHLINLNPASTPTGRDFTSREFSRIQNSTLGVSMSPAVGCSMLTPCPVRKSLNYKSSRATRQG